MGKLYKWNELASNEQLYLLSVSGFFRKNCNWPNYRLLERELRQQDSHIDFDETAKSVKGKFRDYPQFYSWDPKQIAVLNILALHVCPNMQDELSGFMRILRYCVDRYDSNSPDETDPIQVTFADLMTHLDLSQTQLCKSAVLFKEGPWQAFRGDPINENMNWSFDIGENIRSYRNVTTIEEYIDVKYGKDEVNLRDSELEPRSQAEEASDLVNSEPRNASIHNASTEVFVVHGHDEGARESAARYLESEGLTPIILHEQANRGMTIIEKFEKHSDVPYAVILLTPDDVGMPKDSSDELKPRARQNVIFEWGYFVGRLGRGNVCALYKRGVELPSDMDGLIWIEMDTPGAWRFQLQRELKEAGIIG